MALCKLCKRTIKDGKKYCFRCSKITIKLSTNKSNIRYRERNRDSLNQKAREYAKTEYRQQYMLRYFRENAQKNRDNFKQWYDRNRKVNPIFVSAIETYNKVITGEIQRYPRGFWQQDKAKRNAFEIMNYVFSESDEPINFKSIRKHKLRGILYTLFNNDIDKLLEEYIEYRGKFIAY